MTVATEESSIEYEGNGATVEFPTTFPFPDETDLVVTVDDVLQTLGTDYTVSTTDDEEEEEGEGDEGGTVTFEVAPEDGAVIVITRDLSLTQDLSLRNQGAFSTRVHERALDRLTMVAQQLQRQMETLEVSGVAGPAGATGAAGATGPTGPVGSVGPRGPVSFVHYDIRDYDAEPGAAGATATTNALQEIFAAISAVIEDGETTQSATDACIFIPFADDGWYVNDTVEYIGNPGKGLVLYGQAGLIRGDGTSGSRLIWSGAAGGTMLDLRGINGSEIRDINFSGGTLTKYVLRLREHRYQGASDENLQVSSSGVNIRSCFFQSPGSYSDSVLCAAGDFRDETRGTQQASEYRFFSCYFQGHNNTGLQGWGFKALDNGNTKNYAFSNCIFNDLHRGIESDSGYLFVNECNAANIGYDRPDSALIWAGGNVITILGGSLENNVLGYASKYLYSGGGTKVVMQGVYIAASAPADDYIVEFGGPSSLLGVCFEGNARDVTTFATMIAWTAATAYTVGQERYNGSHAYRCTTAGTSAGSGGPTGTGEDIADGSAVWDYASPRDSNVLKVKASAVITDAAGAESESTASLVLMNCSWRYKSTELLVPPIYDGSNNPMFEGSYPATTEQDILVIGCRQGLESTTVDTPMRAVMGQPFLVPSQSVLFDLGNVDLISPGVTPGRQQPGLWVCTVPYSAFSSETSRTLNVGYIKRRWRITSVVADTTAAFGGTAGTLSLKVGMEGDDDIFIVSHDVKTAPVTKGLADADLGVGLARATAVAGGCMPSWTDETTLTVTLTSSSGDLGGLTTGSVILYFRFEPMQ